MVPKLQVLAAENGLAVNLYINGTVTTKTPAGNALVVETETQYPKTGAVKMKLGLQQAEQFQILLRVPEWSKDTKITCNGEAVAVTQGYTVIDRVFENGDVLEICLDMRTVAIRPIPYGSQVVMTKTVWVENAMVKTIWPGDLMVLPLFDKEDPLAKKHVAFRRGPVMLAKENRLGYSVEDAMDLKINPDETVDAELIDNSEIPYECILGVKVPLQDGTYVKLSDYASAGKLWTEENKMAVWLLIP